MPSPAALLALSVLSVLPLPYAAAQTLEVPAISTERPSVGTTADITPPHSSQIENGLNAVYSPHTYVADLPESLLRVGIGHNAELRFTSANLVHRSDEAAGASFAREQDISFSGKLGLAKTNSLSLLPQAMVVALSCPTGSAEQTSGSYDPTAILVWHQVTRNGLNVLENLSFLRTTIDGDRKDDWGLGIVVTRNFTPKLAWFAEYAPMFAADAAALHVFDGGLIYTPVPTTQFDLKVGRQNDPGGLDNILALGYSFRVNGLGHRVNVGIH